MMLRACHSGVIRKGLQVLALCVVICGLMWFAINRGDFFGQLAYSVSMGMLTWAIIDLGRFFVDQDSPHLFPRGWRGVALIGSGVLLGFILGQLFGDWVNGNPSFALLKRSPEFFAYVFLFSMATGTGIALFFYSQGKSAYYQAELEATSRQATEAQLKLLQSQLDPHMLFNTLANLRVLIQSEPARAVQMLDQLNDFLRSSLSASRSSEHTLQAEFDRLHDYLSLMQIRMGKRLTFSLDLPSDLAQTRVPTLILQSLVENAVVHGLEPKVTGGSVRISAAQELGVSGKQLVLQVTDDGLGFDPSVLKEGFGITQVRERLQSRYGHQATIEFIAVNAEFTRANNQNSLKNAIPEMHATPATGCQVILRLPLPD